MHLYLLSSLLVEREAETCNQYIKIYLSNVKHHLNSFSFKLTFDSDFSVLFVQMLQYELLTCTYLLYLAHILINFELIILFDNSFYILFKKYKYTNSHIYC